MRLAIATAPKRDSRHWAQTEISWEEIVGWATTPAKRKEAGNYLLGSLRPDTTVVHARGEEPCTNRHRRKDFVLSRSGITLDVDTPAPDFLDRVEVLFPYLALIHTTYSSSPDEPRYRIIIPTSREMAPDEYVVAARSVMVMLGEEQFDPGTTQPERYMFRPAARQPGWFRHQVIAGPVFNVDTVLGEFEEDLSVKPLPRPGKNKRNPFDIEGVVGAFNTAYQDWDLLISSYDLPYVRVAADRYQLAGSRAQAGMGPIGDEGFVYSHHSNDPAYGQACSAFDLVRLHRFGELDEDVKVQTPVNKRPSHLAMLETATQDPRVTAQLVGVDFATELEETATSNDWRLGLELGARSGKVLDIIHNWDLIREHDPVFSLLCYNEMSLSAEFRGDPPWRKLTPTSTVVGSTDRWQFGFHIERTYGIRPSRGFVDSLIDTQATARVVNPVRDYLESLVWDQEERLETCLPGVRPTPYTRFVARKVMVAAAARMLAPGCKWDHTLVLYGSEGIGKSWWIDRVARGYSASLGNLQDKDTLLTMQRSWVMVSDEGHSLRKHDQDQQKEFLTRTADMFRMPYDRETLVHPRHCVIWSTTNDETFLRRQEGNRRFLIVHCEDKFDFDNLTGPYVDQLWAEAVYLYQAGERLYLGDMESLMAAEQRERFVEEDVLGGLIQDYLDTPVPPDWWEKSRESRQKWLVDRADGFEPDGIDELGMVCSAQVWVEALGRRPGDARRGDLLDITNALKRLSGWIPGGRRRVPGYGPQLVFIRDPQSSATIAGATG